MRYLFVFIFTLLTLNITFATNNINISNVKAKYTKIKTIQGNFTQTQCLESEGTCQRFEGKFFVSKPYFSRLEVTNPEKQLIISDSNNLYIYLVNKKKVYIQSADAGINFFKIFDLLLNDTLKFKMSNKEDNYCSFEFKKDTLDQYLPSQFENLRFLVNTKSNLIEKFSFTDINGLETEFELSKMKINEKLSAKLFQSTIPKDVEVIQ